jgi:hypothetical protein
LFTLRHLAVAMADAMKPLEPHGRATAEDSRRDGCAHRFDYSNGWAISSMPTTGARMIPREDFRWGDKKQNVSRSSLIELLRRGGECL